MEEEKQTDIIQKLEESNFKVKFTRISYKDYEKSHCEVCFQSKDKSFPPSDDEEKGVRMMVCYGCSLKCHQYCYGIDTQTQEESIKNNLDQKVIYFLCQKCRIEPKKQLGCVICNQKKGALKKIENSQTNEWVHITCGLFNKSIVKIESYRTMTFVKQSDAPIEKDKKATKICFFCKSDVGIQSCVSEGCQKHAHFYCIMIYMKEKESKQADMDNKEQVQWFVRMNYLSNTRFDISKGENDTNNLSKNVYFQSSMKHSFNEISQVLLGESIYQLENAASFAQSAEVIPADQKKSKISSAAKKKNKRKQSEDDNQEQNQESTHLSKQENQLISETTKQNKAKYHDKLVELGNLVMKNFVLNSAIIENQNGQQEEQSVTAIDSETTAQAQSKLNSSTLKKNGKKNKKQNPEIPIKSEIESFNPEIHLRGGEILIECPDHRKETVYCVCQKVDSLDDQVFCNLCNDWYHYGCVKYQPKTNEDEDENYTCSMCEEWYAHKRKKLLKEFYSGKVESFGILTGNLPKFNLMDFISIILMIDQRIQNLLFTQKKGNIDTQINDMVNSLSYIPLFSTKIQEITVFKQRKYLHQAANDFLQKILEETDLLKLVSAVQIDENNPVKYIVLEENLKKNEELKRLIDGISALFQRNKTKEKGILVNLKKPINWILKVHSAFFKKQEKISPLILQELMKDEEEDVKNTVEYQLLDQFVQRLKAWNTKVFNFYENIIQKANNAMEQEKSETEAIVEKKQIEEDEFIYLKYKQWRDRLNTRPTIEDLEQILQEGREIPVDCSQEIKKLESEKDEVQIWFQTLDEKERTANLLLSQKLKQEERVNKSNHVTTNDQDGKIKKESSQSASKTNTQEGEQIQQEMNGQSIQAEEEVAAAKDAGQQNQVQKQAEQENNQTNQVQAESTNKEQMNVEENEQNGKVEQTEQEKMNEQNGQPKESGQQETAMEIEKGSEKEEQKENNSSNKQEQEGQAEGVKVHLDNEIYQKIYKNQQLMSKGDFEIFANQMFTKVVLQVPRMSTIIDMLQQYETNEIQWERLLEFINEKEQENVKKQQQEQEQNVLQDEQIQQQIILSQYINNNTRFELIEYQELQDLLDSCLKLEIKVPFLNSIAQQMNGYLEQKAQFQSILNSNFDETNYFQQLKKIQALPFVFEEEKTFYERIIYFKEIQDISKNGFKKVYNLDQLQKLSEICQSSKFPQEITSEFDQKTELIISISKRFNKIVETGLIEKEQLEEAKELTDQINQMKNIKIDFKRELDIFKLVQKSSQLFRSLHKFFFNLNEEQIKLDPSMRVQEIDLEVEDMLEAKNIDECLADIQEKWSLVCSNLNQVKGELFSFIKEGLGFEHHYDKRINKIFKNLSEMYWVNDSKILLSQQDPKIDQIYQIYQSALMFKINSENETFQKVKELFETKKKEEEILQQKQKQQYQEIQQQFQKEQEKLKLQQMQQQQQLQSKNINLVVSDDSINESQKSDYEEIEDDEDDEDDDDEEEDEDDDDEEEEDDEDDDDDKDDSKTDKDGRDDNNDDDDENGRNNTNQKGNQKKNDLCQIDSDISLMNEEESQQNQQLESDTNNLNEAQKSQYNTLFEQGQKWKNEVKQAYQIIKNCSNQDSGDNNKMDIEKFADDHLVTFQQLKNLLQEGYKLTHDIIQLNKSVQFMKSKMIILENIFIQIHNSLDQFNKIKNPDLVDDSVKIQNCIDISDILIEYKVNLSSDSQEKLSFKNMIKFPFKNLNKFASTYKKEEDLSYFVKETDTTAAIKGTAKNAANKNKDNSKSKEGAAGSAQQNYKQKQQQKQQDQQLNKRKQKVNKQSSVIELESQDNTQDANNNNNESKSEKSGQQMTTGLRQKSTRNKTKLVDSDFVYFTKHSGKEEVVGSAAAAVAESKQKQKAKQNNKHTAAENKKAVESQDENSEDEGDDDHDSANLEQKAKREQVSDGDRSKTAENLRKAFIQNEAFSKSLQYIKAIENQLFGELNKDRKKYLTKAQQFANLFIKLSAYPQISKKLISKGFQISALEKLMSQNDQKFDSFEKSIKEQQMQQQENQAALHNNNKSVQSSSALNNKNAQQTQSQQNNNQNQVQRTPSQQNVQSTSQPQKNLNSAKEPQLQKKVKPFDSFVSMPGLTQPANSSSQSAQQSTHNSNSVLSMLIQKTDSSKNNSNSNNNNSNNRQKDGNKYNSNNATSSLNSFQNKFKEDQLNKKNNQNYMQTNNRKRRNQQANFSEESENEEVQSKNDSQQEFSKDLFKSRNQSLNFDDDIKINKKSSYLDYEKQKQEQKQQSPESVSQAHQTVTEDKQTPKSSINKQDDENIEQIQNIFNSESKIYTFDKTCNSNQQSQGTELLYNPDEEEEEGGQGGEVEISKINQQYFDFDYDINPHGNSSETNQNSQQNNGSSNYQNEGEKDSLYQKNSSNIKQKSDSFMNKQSSYQNQMEEEPTDIPIPEDCIVRFGQTKFKPPYKDADQQICLNVSMYTLEPIKKLNQFPLAELTQQVDKFSTVEANELNKYISKNLKSKQLIILKGWIEIQNSKDDLEIFNKSIKMQEKNKRVLGFKIPGYNFNIFTENQIKNTDFQFEIKPFNSEGLPVQPFILTKKVGAPRPTQQNAYEFVKFSTNTISQQVVSPMISDNEDDDQMMTKRDSIFEDKYNDNVQQDLKLDIIDFNQLQQQIQELPTADNPPPSLDDKASYDHSNQQHGFQHHGHHQQLNYQGQFNSYQRPPPPPPQIPHINQQGYPGNVTVPPQIPFNHQNYQNNIPNYNMNSTPTHMQLGVAHQQQHHHLHPANPLNFNQQVPPVTNPSHIAQNNQDDSEKKEQPQDLDDIINDTNLDLIDFSALDEIQMILESEPAGTPSTQNTILQSNQPTSAPAQIPPAPQQQQQPIQMGQHFHKMNSSQKQPPLPGQTPPYMHHPQSQQNLSESGSAQNQNPNIDPNLQQLLISQRSKPAYEMNPQIQPPPFNNQPQQQQQPPPPQQQQQQTPQSQQIPNYPNKYPPQQQSNLIPPHQIGNQNQMQPPHPSQYHGHQQQGSMQGQQWNQQNPQNNSQYMRNPQNQNKNQQYGMNNQNSNSYQKGMPNIPPLPHAGQMPNQQQNINAPPNYNNQNMGRQYSHNPQHNQNNNQSGGNNNNMNRQPRYQNNNQGYGNPQYNSNNPNNPNNQNQQQQNFNKFPRVNPNAMNNNNNNNNNNGMASNKGGHGYQQNKNPFGSRQQAHYQRNNQPYTAHNPVPFQDPNTMDNQMMPQQQMQYHPQQQHDNMGDLDQRDYS